MAIAKLRSGLEIFHRDHGSGEPLLLIMGTGADHTFWGAQVPAYRERYRTIVYDARGTGRSSKPHDVESYTMASLADDAAGLLEALGIGAAHVSGLSLGSTVAQEMALRHPDRVRSLQLHGTWARSDDWFCRMIDTLEAPARREDWALLSRTALMWILSPSFLQEDPEEVDRLERAYVVENPYPPSREGILGHLHADKTHDALDRLGDIACPTLVTAGEMDCQVPPRYGIEVANRIPGATLHLFEGPRASHLACLEMAEEFNGVTLDWLSTVS